MNRWLNGIASTFLVGSLWTGSMFGTTGVTFGSFTAATTNAGNTFTSALDWYYPAPLVSELDPSDTATDVPINARMAVSFSEPMATAGFTNDAAGATAFAISQVGANGDPSCYVWPTTGATPACSRPVGGSLQWLNNNTLLVFTPGAPTNLLPSTSYRVTVRQGAKNVAAKVPLAANVSATFTTGTAVGILPQVITPTAPNAGDTNVALNNWVAVTFSQPMNRSVTQTAFRLQQGSTCYVTTNSSDTPPCVTPAAGGAFSWGGPNQNILFFQPNVRLSPNTVYTASVGAKAMDVFGDVLAAPATFSFTTGTDLLTKPLSAPTITSPATTVDWSSAATYAIAGTAPTNTLVQAFDDGACGKTGGTLLATLPLNLSQTAFSISVPLTSGANTFSLNAANAAGIGPCTPALTIHQNNGTETTPEPPAVFPDYNRITVLSPYIGDGNNNSYAVFTCGVGPGCVSPISSAHVAGANGHYSYTFDTSNVPALAANSAYTISATVYDADGFAETSGCGATSPGPPPSCALAPIQTHTVAPNSVGGLVSRLVLVPDTFGANASIASAAGQQQAFKVTYLCSVDGCPTGAGTSSVRMLITNSAGSTDLRDLCGPATPVADWGRPTTSTLFWDGTSNSGAKLPDGTYTRVRGSRCTDVLRRFAVSEFRIRCSNFPQM